MSSPGLPQPSGETSDGISDRRLPYQMASPHSLQMRPRPEPSGQRKTKSSILNPRSSSGEMRNFLVEKEVLESQMRKLQVENSTLHTENKLLKDKYNRAQAKISELEEGLSETQDDLDSLQASLNQQISDVFQKNRSEMERDMNHLQTKVLNLTKQNETLKAEVTTLDNLLESSRKEMDSARLNSERSKMLEACKLEVASFKDEANQLKKLLQESERHLQSEMEQKREAEGSVAKLTEIRNLLQQQLDAGGGSGNVTEKQVKSLEKRLQITEERLHQERADRANNLSQVEEKLLSENARLQASEKELIRQLQREKDKNRNLDNRIRDAKRENEKLRLSLPFDESDITSHKNYDIPYRVHSNQWQESKKILDLKYIMVQIEQEIGLSAGQEKDIICDLWNKKEHAYCQLREWELYLQDLNLNDNNIAEGLKNLREMKGEYETKLRHVEEKIDDIRCEKMSFENTYKEQLSDLVREKHEACARLKTLEDMMDALRSENDMLRQGLSAGSGSRSRLEKTVMQDGQVDALTLQVKNLEGEITQLHRNLKVMEGEMETLRSQLAAREKELQETHSDLEQANSHLSLGDTDARKQQKIDQLSIEVSGLQEELNVVTDRCESLSSDKAKLERQLEDAKHQLTINQTKNKEKKMGTSFDAKFSGLESELAQKDSQLLKVTSQFHEVQSELQQVKQDLFFHQEHAGDLEAQVESLQHQLTQRSQVLEAIGGKEREQLDQMQMVKDTLNSVCQELNSRQAELKVVKLELSQERDKCEALEKQTCVYPQDNSVHGRESMAMAERGGTAYDLRVRELEAERDRLRTELWQSASSLNSTQEEMETVQHELSEVKQDLVNEKSICCQVSAEKVEIEHQLQEVCEDRDALYEEKTQVEEDLVKLESKLQEVLHRFELEAHRQHDGFKTKHSDDTPEKKKMVSELNSLRLLVDGKDRENEVLNDKISRKQMEVGFLHRKVDLLHQGNKYNKEDIDRLTSELILKIKEKSATAEVNQYLVRERTKLQKENYQLEKDLDREKDYIERRKVEVSDVIKKIEHTEQSQRDTVQELHQRESLIATLETDLRQANRNVGHLETENEQLKSKVDHLNEDIQNLTAINSKLENRLEMERASLDSGKMNLSKKKEELTNTSHKLEAIKHEQSMLLNNLTSQRKTVEQLKEEISIRDAKEQKLHDQIQTLQQEIDTQQGQIVVCRENIEQLKKEKTVIYQDYQDVCRRLSEKDRAISDLQEKSDWMMESAKREVTLQKSGLNHERASMEKELHLAKDEVNDVNEKLRQKEIQLSSFGRTLQELEDTIRQKKDLETKIEKLESTAGESKILLDSHRIEMLALKDSNKQLQETLGKTQVNYHTQQEQLRTQLDSSNGQVVELQYRIKDLKEQHESEKYHLKETLNHMEANLHSLEMNFKNIQESRDQLQADHKILERSMEDVKCQLSEEAMGRKISEQSLKSVTTHVDDLKKKKTAAEECVHELQTTLAQIESELKVEKENVRSLTCQVQEFEAAAHGNESTARAKQEQVEMLQLEINKLQQMLDSQKHQLGIKYRKSTLELKQQLESAEQEKMKLAQHGQQLSVDLEQSREHNCLKNKENLKLQENMLSLEEQIWENSTKLRQAQDSLRMEEDMQTRLNSRFQEQEEELKRLRTFLARKAEEEGDGESKGMWQEMNRVIQELSRQMQHHLESQAISDKDARDRESKLSQTYKKQINDLESELNTERALHQITRGSLQALEEDCTRLRQQLHSVRRKSSSPDKKQKSRMEEINELIARSQTRAQAMLASGAYFDGTFKHLNPTRDYNTNSHLEGHQSPDTTSQISDCSFGSTSPVAFMALLNTSGTHAGGSTTPRKSSKS